MWLCVMSLMMARVGVIGKKWGYFNNGMFFRQSGNTIFIYYFNGIGNKFSTSDMLL